jgi:REP element-mobilizing transposase RayT
MIRYKRRLPHWDAVGGRMFVTFRLRGSLPVGRAFPPERLTGGEAFVAMDKMPDNARTAPLYLNQPEIASMVMKAILDGDAQFGRYDLHAFVIMQNHVNMLVTPHVPARDWLRSLKDFTGREANRILNRTGKSFWQEESYDHLVRNDLEFNKIKRYIEWNPVKAGLADAPETFLWSSAAPGGSPAAGQKP